MRAYRRDDDGVWITETVDGVVVSVRPLAPRHASSEAVAGAILEVELAVGSTDGLRRAFCSDVLDPLHLPFALSAPEVWAWVREHRALVDAELFLAPRDAALAITTDDPEFGEVTMKPGDATASAVVAACEAAWRDIATHHPELPDAVIVLGSGVERGRLVKLGHWWGGRWVADGAVRGEVLLAGEALHLPPEQVFEVLLHEAAHGLNAARGIKDTSRGGRYHNQRFAATAREVLLRVRSMAPYGLASTSLTPKAAERYAESIERLGAAIRIARQVDARATEAEPGAGDGGGGDGAPGRGGSGRSVAAACGCGRRLRIAPSTLAAGPIVCGTCSTEFVQHAGKDAARSPVVDHSFTQRRQAVLDAERKVQPPDDARLQRQRDRLAAILAEAPADVLAVDLLAERLDRIDQLVGSAVRHPSATLDQKRGLAQLADGSTEPRDLDALRAWYERFGTSDEVPMRATNVDEAARRERLARALLLADGTLRGPDVGVAGRSFATGDRVIAGDRSLDTGPPAGVLGTVVAIDEDSAVVDIDFATWGRLRARLADLVDDVVRHDYTAPPEPLSPTIELERFAPEVEL